MQGDDLQVIREYLLRGLDEHRHDQFEERLLTDTKLQAELSEAQHDLIDDYVFGLLNDRERALFEKNFALNDERVHIVRLSEALLKYTESNPLMVPSDRNASHSSGWRQTLRFLREHKLAAACVGILLLAVSYGLWSIYNHKQLERQLATLQAQRRAIEKELAKLNADQLPDARASIITITLRPLLRDAGETSQVGIEKNTEFLQLKLELMDDQYVSYRAVIETIEGSEMYRVNNLKTQPSGNGKTLVMNLPGQLLPVGSYQIHLIGVTSTGQELDCCRYPFQIVHE